MSDDTSFKLIDEGPAVQAIYSTEERLVELKAVKKISNIGNIIDRLEKSGK